MRLRMTEFRCRPLPLRPVQRPIYSRGARVPGCGSWLTRCYRTPYSARSKAIRRLPARFVQLLRQSCTIFLRVENQRGGSFARGYQAFDYQHRIRALFPRASAATQNICRFGAMLRFAKICRARNREACRGPCLAARRAGGVRGVRVRDCHSARRILKSARPTSEPQVQPAFRPPEGNPPVFAFFPRPSR